MTAAAATASLAAMHAPTASVPHATRSLHTAAATENPLTARVPVETTKAAAPLHDATVPAATTETIEKNNIEYHEYIAFR